MSNQSVRRIPVSIRIMPIQCYSIKVERCSSNNDFYLYCMDKDMRKNTLYLRKVECF